MNQPTSHTAAFPNEPHNHLGLAMATTLELACTAPAKPERTHDQISRSLRFRLTYWTRAIAEMMRLRVRSVLGRSSSETLANWAGVALMIGLLALLTLI